MNGPHVCVWVIDRARYVGVFGGVLYMACFNFCPFSSYHSLHGCGLFHLCGFNWAHRLICMIHSRSFQMKWLACGWYHYGSTRSNCLWVICFILFRVFDILKPGPVKWAEKLDGGLGMWLILVAVLSALVILCFDWFNFYQKKPQTKPFILCWCDT